MKTNRITHETSPDGTTIFHLPQKGGKYYNIILLAILLLMWLFILISIPILGFGTCAFCFVMTLPIIALIYGNVTTKDIVITNDEVIFRINLRKDSSEPTRIPLRGIEKFEYNYFGFSNLLNIASYNHNSLFSANYKNTLLPMVILVDKSGVEYVVCDYMSRFERKWLTEELNKELVKRTDDGKWDGKTG